MLLYQGAWEGADALVMSTQYGVEDLIVVHEPEAVVGYALDLPPNWHALAPHGIDGLVEIRDASNVARVRMWARGAWDAEGRPVPWSVRVDGPSIRFEIGDTSSWPVAFDPEWLGTDTLVVPRRAPTITPLPDGRVLLCGGEEMQVGSCEAFDPLAGTFTITGAMLRPRTAHTATLLEDGTVLLAGGGIEALGIIHREAEVHDPQTGQSATVGEMLEGRYLHASVALPGGKVLLTGGRSSSSVASSVEIYDPASQTFSNVGQMSAPRAQHTATALPSGDVLIAGGFDGNDTAHASLDVFRPNGGTVAAVPTGTPRFSHSATALPDGRVLLSGGCSEVTTVTTIALCDTPTASVEVYDPKTGTVQAVGKLAMARVWHGAVLLSSGQVLIVGGVSESSALSGCEAIDPTTFESRAATPLSSARWAAGTALLPTGQVLTAGGFDAQGAPLASSERFGSFEPASWSFQLLVARSGHNATRLEPSGRVLISGGSNEKGPVSKAEVFDPDSQTFFAAGEMKDPRFGAATSLLPSGKVLVTGGKNAYEVLDTVEIYDPATNEFEPGPSMTSARMNHVQVTLHDGRVLLATGTSDGQTPVPAEVYDSDAEAFSVIGASNLMRIGARETLLGNGTVLLTGGGPNWVELFDPTTDTFDLLGTMPSLGFHTCSLLPEDHVLCVGRKNPDFTSAVFDPTTLTFSPGPDSTLSRHLHRASTLPGGRLLFTGGFVYETGYALSEAEVYDPAMGAFAGTGPMSVARIDHTATTLHDGRVLVAGGKNFASITPPDIVRVTHDSAELYDPATGLFSTSGPYQPSVVAGAFSATLMPSREILLVSALGAEALDLAEGTKRIPGGVRKRDGHTASVSSEGLVLLAGGEGDGEMLGEADLYDPLADMTLTIPMAPRTGHTATSLPDGSILLVGGHDGNDGLSAMVKFRSEARDFAMVGMLGMPRSLHGAALLPSGRVLIAGGVDPSGSSLSNAEIIDYANGSTVNMGDLSGPGPTVALAQASGEVILAGDGWACRFSESTKMCSPLVATVEHAYALTPTLFGASLLCGVGACTPLDTGTNLARERISVKYTATDSGSRQAAAVMSSLADLLVVNSQEGLRTVSLTPNSAVRPKLEASGTKAKLVSGRTAFLRGSRFARCSAAGCQGSQQPRTDAIPTVAFVPANHGPATYGRITRWTDTEIEWIPPETVHRGPGWVHVMVGGVPSEGLFAVVEGSPLGSPCVSDPGCESGFCAENVCCDRRCGSACESCLGGLQGPGGSDGTCGPILVDTDPKSGCAAEDKSTCGFTGACNGEGECARYPEGHDCGSGVCRSGKCSWCDGDRVVSESSTTDCVPFACHEALCWSRCETALECAGNHICVASGVCKPFVNDPGRPDPGSCSLSRSHGDWPTGWVAALVACLLGRRRRRSESSRCAQLRE
jgi:MYXO-CTERM domain-containing protein